MTLRQAQGGKPGAHGAKRVVWQAASVCLSYPDETTLARGPLLRRALVEAAPEALAHFAGLLEDWATTRMAELQVAYVDLFDLSRRHSLYLSYWTDGDTRRRGEVLAGFKQRYRRSEFAVDTHGELTDFLPMVLEYAAVADPSDGASLLQEYRRSLELLRLALREANPSYGCVLTAVCETLPGASPTDRRAVVAMAETGPPMESVGLDAHDPRLLPLGGRP